MSIGNFLIKFVVTMVLFVALHVVASLVFVGSTEAFMAVGRPMDAPEQTWGYLGHMLQTVGYVLLFGMVVKEKCWKAGAMFGFMVGLILGGTDLVYFGATYLPSESAQVFAPVSVVVSTIVGAVLGLMNKKEA